MNLKNENIKISELGEENTFVSGTKNWRIEWAEVHGQRFEIGTKVKFFDEDDQKEYIGVIDWIIATEDGYVEASLADTPLGRIDVESLNWAK